MPEAQLPGAALNIDKMPGHWLLARLGKRVLRPGGRGLTRAMLDEVAITPADDIVELAPGLGLTAGMMLERKPHSYTGIERDAAAVAFITQRLPHSAGISIRRGEAEGTGLGSAEASVVVAEAMLTMNPEAHKQAIVAEAFRLLRPGGRYAIHELAIVPDDVDGTVKSEIEEALSRSIRVGARPLTEAGWRRIMTEAGFTDLKVHLAPMNLLRPSRILADEGLWRTLTFVRNVVRDRDARRRVLAMRAVFNRHAAHLRGIAIVGRKPA